MLHCLASHPPASSIFIICSAALLSPRFTEGRQGGAAVGCFALLMAPVWSRLWYLYRTRSTHVVSDAPTFKSFLHALGPGVVPYVFFVVVLVAALTRKLSIPDGQSVRQ